jgi:hypothetical protein
MCLEFHDFHDFRQLPSFDLVKGNMNGVEVMLKLGWQISPLCRMRR